MARKKSDPKRTQAEIQLHYKNEARYYLKGWTLEQMAQKIGLSVPTIMKDLEVVKEQWKQSTLVDFDEAQGAALDKIDQMEAKCIEKFNLSEKEKRTVTQKRIPMMKDEDGKLYVDTKGKLIIDQAEPKYIVVEETIKKEENVGDVRWLTEIRALLDMRMKILGLYKLPEKANGKLAQPTRIAQENTKGKVALLLALVEEWGDTDKSD